MTADRFAVKRLASVEVESTASHQHEFNAGALRSGLGIVDDVVRGPLTILFYESDFPPLVEESSYTLYDSRKNKPHRSAEYRLYYTSPLVSRVARPGDLLVVYRGAGAELNAVIARPGTAAERDLQLALLAGETTDEIRRFLVVTPPAASLEAGLELGSSLLPAPSTALSRKELSTLVEGSAALRDALVLGGVPPSREMAEAARRLADEAYGGLQPDRFLLAGLEAETALYFEMETRLGEAALESMVRAGELSFESVIRLTQKYHQSRKARRGLSLQHHFAALLRREQIAFDAQCATEGKERPDFIIPGCRMYHDPEFPGGRLRMVACKSRTRERWDQVLNEAARIERKFLLTMDEDLTDDLIKRMTASRIRVFIPQDVIEEHYSASTCRELLSNVDVLIAELRSVV